jgi:hypothetical protein
MKEERIEKAYKPRKKTLTNIIINQQSYSDTELINTNEITNDFLLNKKKKENKIEESNFINNNDTLNNILKNNEDDLKEKDINLINKEKENSCVKTEDKEITINKENNIKHNDVKIEKEGIIKF